MAEEIKFLRQQQQQQQQQQKPKRILLLEFYFRLSYPTVRRVICLIDLKKILIAKICLKVVFMMKSPSVVM